jgi:hypothetical protein
MDPFILIILICVVLLIITAVLQWLWNTTIPELFGLKEIRYWQAFRLIIICKLLLAATPGMSN